jgi:hypothetical protein
VRPILTVRIDPVGRLLDGTDLAYAARTNVLVAHMMKLRDAWRLLILMVFSVWVLAEPVPFRLIDMTERRERLADIIEASQLPGSNLRALVVVTSTSVPPHQLELRLVIGEDRYPLRTDAAGVVFLDEYADQLRSMTGFEVYPPEDDVEFYGKVVPRLPLAREIVVSDALSAVHDMNAMIRQEAGMLAFMAPKISGIQVQLDASGYAEISDPEGVIKKHTTEGHWLQLPLDDSISRITLSATPIRFDFLK